MTTPLRGSVAREPAARPRAWRVDPLRTLRTVLVVLANLHSPARRHRHARVLHAIRVGIAILVSVALTSLVGLPHGAWASVSVMVVIGGLQHQGNIRQKGLERGLGTAIGALFGMLFAALYEASGSAGLSHAAMAVTAGLCAYHAVGRGGYTALLTGITMCIVLGHGDDPLENAFWRTGNVFIGIAIALAFAFALPLRASYSWRHSLALNLRREAGLMRRLLSGTPVPADERLATFLDLSGRLVSLRGLMPSVASESNFPLNSLEAIQRGHRALVSAMEMLGSQPMVQSPGLGGQAVDPHLLAQGREVRRALLQIARALRSADPRALERPLRFTPKGLHGKLPAEIVGPYWLLERIATQTEQLRQMLRSENLGLLK